jgi:hypothetical protein
MARKRRLDAPDGDRGRDSQDEQGMGTADSL